MDTNSTVLSPELPQTQVSSPTDSAIPSDENRLLKVMHVLSVSLPHINGYALRSKYVVETQAESGCVEPVVVTSPFYPGLEGTAEDEIINGIPYYRVANPQDKNALREPSLWVFVVLHWMKSLVNWAIPALRRMRRKGVRAVRLLFRFVHRRLSRMFRYTMRVIRCAQRVASSTGKLIEAITEPVIGKRFLPAMEALSRAIAGGMWLLSRPFAAFSKMLKRAIKPSASRFHQLLRRLMGLAVESDGPLQAPLRQRLMARLQDWEKLLLIRLFERKLEELYRKVSPDVIHVHSPYFCAVPAVKAAKTCEIPVVYEVRGIWEESGVAQGSFERDSDRYRMWHRQETWAMKNADAVTCICEQLREEIVGRAVDRERVFVASNAVDSEVFAPELHSGISTIDVPDSVAEVRHRLGQHTIGYIGSIRPLEGVDGLVRGAAEVIRRGHDATLLIVGGGDVEQLQGLAEELGIADRAIFTGQIPHDEVQFYYELIDIFVISRPASRVAKLVTPLKPLEAMAMQKTLVVSDLPALRELVSDGKTGLIYHAEDHRDLADKCEQLIEDSALSDQLAASARRWVCEERSWQQTIGPQLEAYAAVVPTFTAPNQSATTTRKAA